MPTKPPAKPWTEHYDLVITIASPEVAADKLGRTKAEIMARRKELGLPEVAPASRDVARALVPANVADARNLR
jgi:hypothetical protein